MAQGTAASHGGLALAIAGQVAANDSHGTAPA